MGCPPPWTNSCRTPAVSGGPHATDTRTWEKSLSCGPSAPLPGSAGSALCAAEGCSRSLALPPHCPPHAVPLLAPLLDHLVRLEEERRRDGEAEIGRASCRERLWGWEGVRAVG